jgi:hypothetical protein
MMAEFLDQLEADFRSGIRGHILTGNLWDYVLAEDAPPARLAPFLTSWLESRCYVVVTFSRSSGCRLALDGADEQRLREQAGWVQKASGLRLGLATESNDDPARTARLRDTFTGLTRLLNQSERRAALVVDFPQHLAPSTQGMAALASPEHQLALEFLHRWGMDERIRASENRVILLSPEGLVHELLTDGAGGYRVIRVGLPAHGERLRFLRLLEGLRARGRREFAALDPALSVERAAALSAGLRLADLEALLREAAGRSGTVAPEAIRALKARAIKQLCGDLLEIVEPSTGLDGVAGLPHARAYLAELAGRLRHSCPDAPRAILFMGIPGCGKTYLASALSAELGWNCVAMRNVLSKWVGESERNLETVFNVTEAMVPCEFFIDEIDQALAHRGESGDAGTSRRMLKRTMEFLAEERHRGNVLFVAASNAPHLLDPAIDDRFGVKIPFLHPTRAERQALLPLLARQLGRRLADDVDLGKIADLPSLRMTTVRGLLEVLGMAGHWTDSDRGPGEPLSHVYLEAAARAYRPNYNPLQHVYIGLIAVRKTSSSALYPWMRRRETVVERDPEVEIPPYLEGIVDERTGEVDDEALERKIRDLSQALRLDSALGTF